MANTRLPGFSGQDYARANKLGYSNQMFNGFTDQTRGSILKNGITAKNYNKSTANSKPIVAAPSVATFQAPQATNVSSTPTGGVYNTMDGSANGLKEPQIPNQFTSTDYGYEPVGMSMASTANNDPLGLSAPDTFAVSSFSDVVQQPSAPAFGSVDYYSQQDGNAFDPRAGKIQLSEGEMLMNEGLKLDNEIKQGTIDNMGTSWNDWANIGLGAVGTGMQMGLYGDRKDFLSNSNDALEQQNQNAEEAHNTKMANNATYGSAFSNA